MTDLRLRSIVIILTNQHPSGAYVASPNMDDYAYCWFRDGSYIAYAMDLAHEHESARRFHQWAVDVIHRHEESVERALRKVELGEKLSDKDILHTRYTLDGDATKQKWPNYQLDGFGTWLWALQEHLTRTDCEHPPDSWLSAIRIVVRYLSALWGRPCFDCWEEFPGEIHLYTLAAIYGGLLAASKILSEKTAWQTAQEIKKVVLKEGLFSDRAAKFVGSRSVDASLLGLSTPYRVFEPKHPVMQSTVAWIETDLCPNSSGVHRYPDDTYYGGGEWVLLAAWLGWYYSETGERAKAQSLMDWVEDQADDDCNLPEQVPVNLIDPDQYEPWLKNRGEIARPLLWSHAKYLILNTALEHSFPRVTL